MSDDRPGQDFNTSVIRPDRSAEPGPRAARQAMHDGDSEGVALDPGSSLRAARDNGEMAFEGSRL
ncbi:MAG: hypothetical protein QE280_12155 [Caulobacter sp.]|nr:hypothetical protein [Caulobacter sp.]